jgi:hypothetical protein
MLSNIKKTDAYCSLSLVSVCDQVCRDLQVRLVRQVRQVVTAETEPQVSLARFSQSNTIFFCVSCKRICSIRFKMTGHIIHYLPFLLTLLRAVNVFVYFNSLVFFIVHSLLISIIDASVLSVTVSGRTSSLLDAKVFCVDKQLEFQFKRRFCLVNNCYNATVILHVPF